MNRQSGYYWVRQKMQTSLVPAYFDGVSFWYLIGRSDQYRERQFLEIGHAIERPENDAIKSTTAAADRA